MSPDDERLALKAAAFDALMANIATVRRPTGGDPEVIERAMEILAEPPPDQDERDGT